MHSGRRSGKSVRVTWFTADARRTLLPSICIVNPEKLALEAVHRRPALYKTYLMAPIHASSPRAFVPDFSDARERDVSPAARPARTGMSEEERLRQEVFANEQGFLSSTVYNPVRVKQLADEEEAATLAAEWGSTPERAREILQQTEGEDDMSFQELDRIAEELNMSDEQQRAFLMKASMRQLAAATTPPRRRRARMNAAEDVMANEVFASEQGFLKNSESFKSRMKLGASVATDLEGFPLVENDPMVEAARRESKERNEALSTEDVEFPTLPDCPRCSAPSMVEELERFGMCTQCKGQETMDMMAASNGAPAAPSRFTYDNGEAPFSSSWHIPSEERPSRECPPGASADDFGAEGGTPASSGSRDTGDVYPVVPGRRRRRMPPYQPEGGVASLGGLNAGVRRRAREGDGTQSGGERGSKDADAIRALKTEVSELRAQVSEYRSLKTQMRSAVRILRQEVEALKERLSACEEKEWGRSVEGRGRRPPPPGRGFPPEPPDVPQEE